MKKESICFRGKRLVGYGIGFILFYAPFDLFARAVDLIIPPTQLYSIHEPCFRIPMNLLLSGHALDAGPVSIIAVILLLLISLIFGPLFCGVLCPAGALPEFLSRLLPDKVKIDWAKYLPVVPIRYGFLIGFLLAVFAGITEHCSYCNFFVFDMLISFFYAGRLPVYSISLIMTFILWFLVLGIFTKGGRGFCNFLCPVGAVSGLMHYVGSRFPWAFRMKIDREACIGCGQCVKQCPMRAIQIKDKKAIINEHHCIICRECSHECVKHAVHYGKGV